MIAVLDAGDVPSTVACPMSLSRFGPIDHIITRLILMSCCGIRAIIIIVEPDQIAVDISATGLCELGRQAVHRSQHNIGRHDLMCPHLYCASHCLVWAIQK